MFNTSLSDPYSLSVFKSLPSDYVSTSLLCNFKHRLRSSARVYYLTLDPPYIAIHVVVLIKRLKVGKHELKRKQTGNFRYTSEVSFQHTIHGPMNLNFLRFLVSSRLHLLHLRKWMMHTIPFTEESIIVTL
jgi:hypothetical protein